MLECVVNIAEGRDPSVLDALWHAGRESVLDVHVDASHHRSVFTLAGDDVEQSARDLARVALERIDIAGHQGAHPRLGVVDVVPFVPLGDEALRSDGDLSDAVRARDAFCHWAASTYALPCFAYGPERSLPDVRRHAFSSLAPSCGPSTPKPHAGACCVGARPYLVAYNLLVDAPIERAEEAVRAIRSADVRALAFAVAEGAQVSCNLVAPWAVGPADLYDRVSTWAPIRRAELVGLIPSAVLSRIASARFDQLGLSEGQTIEARLAARTAAKKT